MTGTLRVGRCTHGHATHPYRPTCPVDGEPLAKDAIGDAGRLLTWTEVARPPTGFEAPLRVGVFSVPVTEETPDVLVIATLDDDRPGEAPDTATTWRLTEDSDGHVRAAPA